MISNISICLEYKFLIVHMLVPYSYNQKRRLNSPDFCYKIAIINL
jgi:hypothetical protein